jgi:hypothetical protein
MLLTNTIVAAICGSTLVSLPAFGQVNPTKADISIKASVPFVDNENSDGARQGVTINHRFLGGYRFFFNKRSGVGPSYGYARSIQAYSPDSGPIGVKNKSDEVLAAYAFRFQAKRWSPHVLAGAGALIFDPKTVGGASTQTRLGYPYGDGRRAHRGVFYNSATFDMGGLNSLDWIPNRVKPAAVFGYNF